MGGGQGIIHHDHAVIAVVRLDGAGGGRLQVVGGPDLIDAKQWPVVAERIAPAGADGGEGVGE